MVHAAVMSPSRTAHTGRARHPRLFHILHNVLYAEMVDVKKKWRFSKTISINKNDGG
jgi:hypothetical protein